MEKSKIKRVSPILAVASMKETIAFYTEVLGFTGTDEDVPYAVVERDGCTVHLTLAADESVLEAVRGHAEIYIEVDDVEPLWEHAQKFSEKYKMKGLIEQPYGMKEFHVNDPNDCLVFVGQLMS